MKKFLALMLAALMVFALAACGGNTSTEKTTAADETTVAEEKKVLTMATNAEFPPYEYYEGDKVVGIDAEVAALFAD